MTLVFSYQTPHGLFETYNEKPHLNFLHVQQTHSAIIIPTHDSCFGLIEADGIIIQKNENKILAIKTADCMPIMIAGENQLTFIHAGWKGLANGIINQAVIQNLNPQYAFIGPSIQKKSFVVTEEFSQHFPEYQKYFERTGNSWTFDLQKTARDMLLTLNPKMVIEDCSLDTYDRREFQSFRRDKNQQRNWNIFYPQQGSKS